MPKNLVIISGIYFLLLITVNNYSNADPTFGQIAIERPIDIKLPDGLPLIEDVYDFVQSIQKRPDFEEPEFRDQDSDIELGEALSMVFELGRKFQTPKIVLCDKYYKLFESDKYLNLGSIEDLVHEDRDLDTIEQLDANIGARLAAESKFNPLKRLATFHRVLNTEGIGVKSTIDVKVQQNLLSCMQYYSDRHRRATANIGEYVMAKRNEIPTYRGNLDKLESQFKYLLDWITNAELEFRRDPNSLKNDILNRMIRLHRTVKMARPMVPDYVDNFISDPKRKDKYEHVASIIQEFDLLKKNVIELEGRNEKLADYRDALFHLYKFSRPHKDWLQEEYAFLNEPIREPFVLGHIIKFESQSEDFTSKADIIATLENIILRRLENERQNNEKKLASAPQEPIYPNLMPEIQTQIAPEERHYRLSPDEQYNTLKTLEDYNIIFYVKPDFDDTHDFDEMIEVMSQVVREVLAKLQAECIHQNIGESCERYQHIQNVISN